MSIITDCEQVLTAARINVAERRDRTLGHGRAWVLLADFDAADPEATRELRVVVGVPTGSDLDALLQRAWTALVQARFDVLGHTVAYGAPPVAGRGLPDGDSAAITLRTRERL